ncbi:MAG TPA: histidine phosphatase family protein [bacterium]|nr:histidine phosphatase family protein [bacterium]HQG46676.1 histidine phosphatase family protein [bacterium]HQI47964.1 histidine phosphatase family protein [bacterium]HQJ65635.1 histidine phosphatase family protein [bacterium]
MKTLYLLRHGKADRPVGMLTDKERPLLPRGIEEVARMARKMVKKGMRPEVILSSPAVRALETARTAAGELGMDPAQIKTSEVIYGGEADELGLLLRHLQEDCDSLLLVGHCPGLEALAATLAHDYTGHQPTGGVIALRLAIAKWEDLKPGCGSLLKTLFP